MFLIGCASHGGAVERKRLAQHREPPVANVTESETVPSSDDAKRRGEQIATSLHAISAVVDALSDAPPLTPPEAIDESGDGEHEPAPPNDAVTNEKDQRPR